MRKLISALILSALCVSAFAQTYSIPAVRVVGVATIGNEPVVENQIYKVKLPVTIAAQTDSAFTGLLPNRAGIYVAADSSLDLTQIAQDRMGPGKTVSMTWLVLTKGNAAYCSPENADKLDRAEMTVGKFKLFCGGGTTFAVLNNTLYVTRGQVRVGDSLVVNTGQSVVLAEPLKVETTSGDEAVTKAVLEATLEACSARLAVPNAEVAPSAPTFPDQPVRPDLVSPSS